MSTPTPTPAPIPDLPTLQRQIRVLGNIAAEYAPATAIHALAAGRKITIPSPSSFTAHVPALRSQSASELDQARRVIGTLSSPPGERMYAPFWDAIPYYIDPEGLHPSLQSLCKLEDQELRNAYKEGFPGHFGDEREVVIGWREMLVLGAEVGGLKVGDKGVKEGEKVPGNNDEGAGTKTLGMHGKAYLVIKRHRVEIQRELWKKGGLGEMWWKPNMVWKKAHPRRKAPCDVEETKGKKRKAEEVEGPVEEVPIVAPGFIDWKTGRLQADMAKTAAKNAELDTLKKAGNNNSIPGPELDELRKKNAELVASCTGFAGENEMLHFEAAQLDQKVARLQDENLAAEVKLSEALAEAKKKEVNLRRRETRSTKKNVLARGEEEQAAARDEENRRLKLHMLALAQRNMELQSELDDFTIRGKICVASATAEKGDVRMV